MIEIPLEEDALNELVAAPDDDGCGTSGVAVEINQSLAHPGIVPRRVKFFICDEGSSIIAAYKHVLKPLFPEAHLLYTTLRLPLADPEFMGEWQKYDRIEGVAIANHNDLVSFWDMQTGVLAKAAQFLVNLQ